MNHKRLLDVRTMLLLGLLLLPLVLATTACDDSQMPASNCSNSSSTSTAAGCNSPTAGTSH